MKSTKRTFLFISSHNCNLTLYGSKEKRSQFRASLIWHGGSVLYYSTREPSFNYRLMHTVLIPSMTKLVDDVVCAISFSVSTERSFGMNVAQISVLCK